MNNGTQNYVLTKKQLYILLVGCGGESVRGLKIDGDIPDKAEIIKTIGELSDRGYVVSDGNNFHTVGDIDKIIKLIMFAPDFYIIKGRNNVPDLCCYGDKKQFAVCEVMVTKADSIRISVCDFESLFSKLFDEGYFENCFDEFFVGDDELREFEARYLEKRDISCENNGSSRRVFSIDKIRADGTGDIDKIIKLIMFAPDFYIIKGRNNVPDLCCYGDKKQFAVCEVMVTKADSIRISVCDFESLFSKLFDEGYFENCFDEFFVGDDELREFEARYLEKRDISCENNGSSRRVFSIDKIRADGTDRYIDIAEYFLCDYILDVDGENVKRTQLSNSEMKKSIKNLLEESV